MRWDATDCTRECEAARNRARSARLERAQEGALHRGTEKFAVRFSVLELRSHHEVVAASCGAYIVAMLPIHEVSVAQRPQASRATVRSRGRRLLDGVAHERARIGSRAAVERLFGLRR